MKFSNITPQKKRKIKAVLLILFMLTLLFLISIGTMVYGFGVTPVSWSKLALGYFAMFAVQALIPLIKV